MTETDIRPARPADGRQARPHHGGRQRALDRLGHRPRPRRPGRQARLHLSGRCLRPARHAARQVGRLRDHRAVATCSTSTASTTSSPRSRRRGAASISSCTRSPSPTARELPGRYVNTTRENFTNTMVISCFSFTEVAKRAVRPDAERRLAADADATAARTRVGALLQCDGRRQGGARGLACAISRPTSAPQGIRVNALSAGPMRTLAGAGISDARIIFNYPARARAAEAHADAGRGGRRRRSTCCRTCPAR